VTRPLNVSFFGLTVPIPPWTIGGFGVLALAGVSGSVYRHIFPSELLSLKQANEALTQEIHEYGQHLNDTPTPIYEGNGLTVRIYSDHCLLIANKVAGDKVLTKLVPSLSRKGWTQVTPRRELPSLFTATLYAQGRCQDPHPGDFKTSYGNRNGCWVEVVRRWPDGCAHVQMLNTCSGSWDANADGSPRVRWTHCRH
jgi:hypothetical protein